jgi:hypothetical protein
MSPRVAAFGWAACALGVLIPTPGAHAAELAVVQVVGGKAGRTLTSARPVPAEAQVRFEVKAEPGAYLTLLQRTPHSLRVLRPGTGDVWVSAGEEVVVPRGGSDDPGAEQPASWTAEQRGDVEFLLVQTSSPRGVPADSWLDDLDDFLAPPPWVAGPAAAPGTIVAQVKLHWDEGEAGSPPSDPSEAGGDDPEDGAHDGEEERGDEEEQGGEEEQNQP